jgi:hypothetical protein
MSQIKELTSFYEAIWDDIRIGPTHISLYMALFQLYNLNQFRNPVSICRKRVMQAAKINGLATYHKCIKDLHEFGYILYLPSFDWRTTSRVNMLR